MYPASEKEKVARRGFGPRERKEKEEGGPQRFVAHDESTERGLTSNRSLSSIGSKRGIRSNAIDRSKLIIK